MMMTEIRLNLQDCDHKLIKILLAVIRAYGATANGVIIRVDHGNGREPEKTYVLNNDLSGKIAWPEDES